ncbi:ABC transporter ATP-binding protein [Acinetobacter brisouii]|uniref:ABC transporter ATP-binding protein n=1 Tax=Acinetobacter brisouii TaxID=396323 RepID=UPI0005F86218|nr:ABC transporter ATP-binding protein [Acinetobacter brisouii]KJV41249.1 ABC transporter ATP-binding protein [Acinetobacter brisouii]
MFYSLKELWQILTPLDRRKLFLVLTLVVIMAFIEAAGVISIMPFLAVLSNPAVIETNDLLKKIYQLFSVENNRQFIVYLGFISLFIVVFSAGFKIVSQYALYRFANLQRHYFSTRLLKIYLQQSYEFFIQRNSSVLVKNVLSETDELVWTLIQPALLMVSYGTVIIAMVAILLFYDPVMAVSTACVLIGFYLGIYWIVKKRLNQIGSSFTQANTGRYQSCQEALSGIKDVIINHAQQGYMSSFEKDSRTYAQHIATRDTLGQVPLHIIETVGYGCLIILAIVLIVSGKDVSHILPVLGLYGFAAYRMLPAAQNIYRAITQIKFSESVFENIKSEFMLEKTSSFQQSKQSLTFKDAVCLENICFAYPNRSDHLVLRDFNLVIPKNCSVGIVGKSGSGKSTLMDIMLGLLHPQQGKILIDGVELTQDNIAAWYSIVGYVPQSIYLADKTIAENIAFGIALDQVDMQAVYMAAKQAQIHEFVEQQLPQGYMTVVGERGVMLSGGQKQRIGIARALYKDPQILFMDEATSALDQETEQAVNEAIQNLSGQKTMVIIAHRENAIAKCSNIIKLENH